MGSLNKDAEEATMDFSNNVLFLLFLTICSNLGEELLPRILVVTGEGYSQRKTEVWPKPESQCTLPDFPLEVSNAVGFLTAQGPMVCGGSGGNKCFLYTNKNHQWIPSTNMQTERNFASAVQIDPEEAIIIGGRDRYDLKTTEVMFDGFTGSEEGKDFPVTIWYHCSFKINSTHALVTGGGQDGSTSASTWFVDLTKTRFTPGPKMTSARNSHGCSTLQLGRKTFGIVSGGYHNGYLDSTEWIDLKEDSPTWTEGPKLPRRLAGHTLVETTQGTYALGGGYDEDWNSRSEVFQLDCPGDQIQSCQWQEMPEKLEVGRSYHVSLSLPESYDICN